MDSLESLESLESFELLEFELLEFEFESSFWTMTGDGTGSFSSLDFLVVFLFLGDALGLVLDVLLSLPSDSDSELLSGENILFFFKELSGLEVFGIVFDIAFDLAPGVARGVEGFTLASTDAAFFIFVDRRLGGIGLGVAGFGGSSSLDDEAFDFAGGCDLGSSFFFGSSSGTGFGLGDFGAGGTVAGVSEVDDSESELLDPDPELVDEVPLLLESEVEPELLSVLLLLTCND